MRKPSENIPGYSYGSEAVSKSSISLQELEQIKTSVGFTEEDGRYLRLAGEVLADQTKQIVQHWRSGIIANIPNLARHSRSPEGDPLPNYLGASNQRFQQWILDTCLKPYDQTWLDYQQEIALRRTIDATRAVARHHRLYPRDERDDPAVPGSKKAFTGGRREDASGLVQVAAITDFALDRALRQTNAERMVILIRTTPNPHLHQYDNTNHKS
jgi:hypothetical protein